MLFGTSGIPTEELTALEFPDEHAFAQAARIAGGAKIPVTPPGRNTLIIRKTDKELLAALPFVERGVVSAADIPPEELAQLWRQYWLGRE